MASGPLVKINGMTLPIPSKYNVTTSTIVDSGRNVAGYVVGNVVRQNVVKVELYWRYLDYMQWKMILTRINGSFFMNVSFFNQDTGSVETRTMYCSDRTAAAFRYDLETNKITGWTDCSLSLVEV